MNNELIPATIINNYKISKCISGNEFSHVYIAEKLNENNKKVIIKELLVKAIDVDSRTEALKKFHEEVRVYKNLKHPYMAEIIDFFSVESEVFAENRQLIVMEYIEGKTMRKIKKERNECISPDDAGKWFFQIVEVIKYLSEMNNPVILYYLTPDHIIITDEGMIKLINFGLGRFFRRGSFISNKIMGITGYSAPEQYGIKSVDNRADIFSAAAVTYYMMTHDEPEKHALAFSPLRTLNPVVSMQFARLISKCVQRKPEDRCEHISDIIEKLDSMQFTDCHANTDKIKKKEELITKKFPKKLTVGSEVEGWHQDIWWTINKYIPARYLMFIVIGIFLVILYILYSLILFNNNYTFSAYLLEYGGNTVGNLDLSKGEIIKQIEIGLSTNRGITVSPDEKYLYVTTEIGKISVVDLSTYKEFNKIIVQNEPVCIFISHKGDKFFVINKGSNSVTVIETETMLVKSTITVGKQPVSGIITGDDQEVYICNYSSNDITAVDLNTGHIKNIQVDKRPVCIVESPSSQKLYVTNSEAENISIIDRKKKNVIGSISVPYGSTDLIITSDEKNIYVANPDKKTILVIDPIINNKVIGEILIKENIASITMSPDEKYIYICSPSQNEKIPGKILVYDVKSTVKLREILTKHQYRTLIFPLCKISS